MKKSPVNKDAEVKKRVPARVFDGKHRAYRVLKNTDPKPGGANPGRVIYCFRTHVRHGFDKIKFIEKVDPNPGSILIEKINSDIYRLFARAPSTRLGLVQQADIKEMVAHIFKGFKPEEQEQIVQQAIAQYLYADNQDNFLSIRGKMISDFHPLGPNFCSQLAHGIVPDSVYHNKQHIDLKGLMKIAATALVLRDLDWLGGSGDNTGYTVEKTASGKLIAQAIIIDTGGSEFLTFKENELRFSNNQLPYCTSGGTLEFKQLTAKQKDEFLNTLQKLAQTPLKTWKYLVERNGAFSELNARYMPGKTELTQLAKRYKRTAEHEYTKYKKMYLNELKQSVQINSNENLQNTKVMEKKSIKSKKH